MNTIFKLATIALFLVSSFALNAQNTVIIQRNDTLIIRVDGEDKVTIVSPEITKIIETIETGMNEVQTNSETKTIAIEINDDDGIIVTQEKGVRVVSLIDDGDDDNKVSNNYRANQCKHKSNIFEPFLNIELGMNNYLNNGQFPDSYGAPYTVKPWGSWNFSIGPGLRIHIGDYLSLNLITDINWYNFKFQDRRTRIEKNNNGLIFGSDDNVQYPLRSKLSVAYIDAQIIPMVHFGRNDDDFNSKMFRIGVGAYAGYRIDSYTKYVDDDLGHKTKLRYHDNYYLENFRYGVKAIFGVQDYNFFANYDLNNLFSERKGPKLNAFSIGLNFTI